MSDDYDVDAVIAAGPQQPRSLPLCSLCGREWHGMRQWTCAGEPNTAAQGPHVAAVTVSSPKTGPSPTPTYETRERAVQPDIADSYSTILDWTIDAIRNLWRFSWSGLDDQETK